MSRDHVLLGAVGRGLGFFSRSTYRYGLVCVGLLGSGLVIACAAAADDEPQLGLSRQEIQIGWVGLTESTTTTGVNLLKAASTSRKGKSTGAIRIDLKSPAGTRASCGLTFISHHRAVTAAHCVDQYSTSETFKVEQYNTSTLDLNAAVNQSDVTGLWPGYTRPVKIGSGNGYQVTPWDCKVTRRCSLSPVSCPLVDNPNTPAVNEANVDIAMVYCSARTNSGLNWVPVATSDPIGQTIEVWWFHELLDLSTANVAYTMPYQPDFNWLHYGGYDGTETNNFHYQQSSATERQQLFPLRSSHSYLNVPYTTTSGNAITTWANMPACHGTSGSGVFRAGTDNLLGVVDYGALSVGGDPNVLCSDMRADPGPQGMGYSSRVATTVFGSLAEVTSDRI